MIMSHPITQMTALGGTAAFAVELWPGAHPSLSFQWQVTTNLGASWDNIYGAADAMLTLLDITQDMNNNRYRVVVSSTVGSVISNSAVLQVTPPTFFINPSAVNINNQFLTQTFSISGTATDTNIYYHRGNLPEAIQFSVTQNAIVVVGTRPAIGQNAVSGTFTVMFSRGGASAALTITVNLTPISSGQSHWQEIDGNWFFYDNGVRLAEEGIFLVPNYWYPAQHGVSEIYKQFGPGGILIRPAHGPHPSIGVFQDGQRLDGWVSWPPGSNQDWYYATATGFATGDTVLKNPWPDLLLPAVADEYIRLLFCEDGILQGKAYGVFDGRFYWSSFTIDQLSTLLAIDVSSLMGWVYLGGLPHGLDVPEWIYVKSNGSVAMNESLVMPNPWPPYVDHPGNLRVFFNGHGFFTHFELA